MMLFFIYIFCFHIQENILRNFQSFLNQAHVDSHGALQILITSLWQGHKDAFDNINLLNEDEIDSYLSAFKIALEANSCIGDTKTRDAILSVAVAGSRLNKQDLALRLGVKDSQVQTAARYS